MMAKPTHPLYSQIAESIRRQILSGELPAGGRIPAVRAQARDWNCTPGTVSRAYRMLAREGLIIARRGQGTLVAGGIKPAAQPALGWAGLVHSAESFLLEALQQGFDLPEGEVAVTLAAANLREALARKRPSAPTNPAQTGPGLRFAGSHDLLLELLAHFLSERVPPVTLAAQYTGSLGGLFAIARGEADLCGVHLWDRLTDSFNDPFILRVLPGRRMLVLTLAQRHLGLILPPGNPRGIAGIADLAKPEVAILNRQPGSGTRVWLDWQLDALGISQSAVRGYDQSVNTHTAVAQAVARGEAAAGVGIYAAAATFGLDFIPLALEPYEIVIPAELAETVSIQALVEIARSEGLKAAIRLLGGYESAQTGRTRWVPSSDVHPVQ